MSEARVGAVPVIERRKPTIVWQGLITIVGAGLILCGPVQAQQKSTVGATQVQGKTETTRGRRDPGAGKRETPDRVIEPKRGQGVEERPREDFTPQGVRYGSFVILPEFATKLTFNDNLFATGDDEKDDFYLDLGPSVRAISNWRNHALNGFVSGNLGRYFERSSENYEDLSVGLDGRLDISRQVSAAARLSGSHLHEERGSVDDANGRSPTTYNLYVGSVSYDHQINRVRFLTELGASVYRFDNTDTVTGLILSDLRDRVEYSATGRAEYMLFDNYGFFASLKGVDIDYDTLDSTGILRSSTGYDARAGALIELTGLLSGEIYGGYVKRRYKDAALPDIGVPVLGTGLVWNVSGLSTIELDVTREIAETTSFGVAGILNTAATLKIAHELKRNIILRGELGYTDSDFRGTSRADDVYNVSIGGLYLLNQNFGFDFSLGYTNRESNDPDEEYQQTVGSITFLARL